MSHTTKHKEKVSDRKLFCDLAEKLGYKITESLSGGVKLYGSNIVKDAIAIHIEGWEYPLAITEDGTIHYDHFGSQHGTMEKLQDLMCSYNEQVTLKNIPMDQVQNYYFETMDDGSRKLVMEYA